MWSTIIIYFIRVSQLLLGGSEKIFGTMIFAPILGEVCIYIPGFFSKSQHLLLYIYVVKFSFRSRSFLVHSNKTLFGLYYIGRSCTFFLVRSKRIVVYYTKRLIYRNILGTNLSYILMASDDRTHQQRDIGKSTFAIAEAI